MRIDRIKAVNIPPIYNFEADNLSDLVVIAGANGSGKSRLVSSLISAFQNSNAQNVQFIVQCTNEQERALFGANSLDFSNKSHREKLVQMLQKNRQRRNFHSGIIYFESDRSVAKVKPLAFAFEFNDPFTENIAWQLPMQPLKDRWQDTQHSIFKKIHTLRSQLGSQAIRLGREGKKEMLLGFSDPIAPFKEAFSKLLAPKILIDPDLQAQNLMYQEGDEKRSIETLSSGEREVLNIAFDFILRNPSDCVVFFDEPELHLHPELLNRLIKTLRTSGERNQFFLISHSPEVIASSLDDTVIFLTKPKDDHGNQATILKPGGETTEALSSLGQSVGVVALGKKVVLIEGRDSSLDTKVYATIAQQDYSDLVFVPAESKADLENFDRMNETVLNKTLWGVQFYMLADKDSVVSLNAESRNFRVLPRYHIENYFLESEIIAECFHDFEDCSSWLRDAAQIEAKLHAIASSKVSYAASLIASMELRREAGNVSIMPSGVHSMNKAQLLDAACQKATEEMNRVGAVLDASKVRSCFNRAYEEVEETLASGQSWKVYIPAKPIFAQFCSEAQIQSGRLKNLYILSALRNETNIFQDIIDIINSFSEQ